jgi:hypothetical protein
MKLGKIIWQCYLQYVLQMAGNGIALHPIVL